MIKYMDEAEKDAIFQAANIMAAKARTAPKAHGADKIVTAIVSGDDIETLAQHMEAFYNRYNDPAIGFVERDAKNIRQCHAVVLIAAKVHPSGVAHCGLCGFGNCGGLVNAIQDAKNKGIRPLPSCSYSATDLGIAIGSAVTAASEMGIDNRVMFSVGRGAIEMGIFEEDVELCYGIPLYTGAKSIFFDRAPGAVIK